MKSNLKCWCCVIAIAAGCLMVLSANSSTAAMSGGNTHHGNEPPAMKGENPHHGIAPPNSNPLGESYNEWVVLAQQWYYSSWTIDPNVPSPGRDFGHMVVPPMANLLGVTVPVTMTVDQWFFVPICFGTWANTPGDWGYDNPWSEPYGGFPTYEAWARDQLKVLVDAVHPTCTIDGKLVQNIDLYRRQTGLFDLVLPFPNAWGVPAGTYSPNFTDGWFAILRPLPLGKHTVTNATGEGQFVTYEITVIPERDEHD
jgi:hypothetical protein